MDIKKGFTLTEVLITLGIIGIVSALTIPQLFNKTRNAHLGAQLANAISTLENGTQLYLHDQNVRNTTQISDGPSTISSLFSVLAGDYIKMKSYSGSPNLDGVSCSNYYSLADKSVVGVCGDTLSVHTGNTSSEIVIVSSASLNQAKLIEGLDFFRVSFSADGNIYIPGVDYGSGNCDEKTGGYGCVGQIAKNGWKVNY